MGFLSGLLETAGAAAPIAANVMAARNVARAQAASQERQQALQFLLLKQQQEKQDVANLLARSNARHVDAETADLQKKHTYIRGVGGQSFDATDPNNVKPVTPAPVVKPTAPVMGTPEWEKAYTVKKTIDQKYAPQPTPTNVYLPSVNKETGETDYTVVPNRGPVSPKNTGVIKPPTGGAGGVGSGVALQTLARQGMSMNDLQSAVQQMDDYENNPANLKKLTPFKQAEGAASEVTPNHDAHGFLGALDNAAGSLVSAGAQKHLASSDPAYRTYLFNKQRVATAFTELLPRPNQQILGIEKGLSGVDVGWNPTLMMDVQSRRRLGLQMLKTVLSSSPIGQKMAAQAEAEGAKAAPSAPKAPATKDYGIFGKGGA